MEKHCAYCGKVFETEYPSKLYCCPECARRAYYERDISCYADLENPDAEILYSFECAECGRRVNVTSIYNQRTRFCCGKCAYQNKLVQDKQRLAKQRYTSNLGMSGGMSLGSLIKREARSVDREDTVYINTCPVCGKTFETRQANRKYCGTKCRDSKYKEYRAAYHKARYIKKVVECICPVCGKKFERAYNRQVYCSKECYLANRAKLPVLEKRVCLNCGKEFETEDKNRKYCSEQCRNRYNLKRYRVRRKEKSNG